MKILLATSTINETGGGISSYAIDFIKIYHDEHNFLVISNDKLDEKYALLIPKHIKFSSDHIKFGEVLRLLKIIDDYKPDIVINSAFVLLSIAIPYIDQRIKKISISHFVDGELAIIAGFNHHYYSNIIALSNEGTKSLSKYYPTININKFKIIYNFYKPVMRGHFDVLQKTQMKIVYPGGTALHKNPYLVFKILRGLIKSNCDFKFYWLGNILLPGSRFFYKKNVSDLFKPDKRILFTGNIEREEAVKIIQDSDIFLLPSLKEGCPITLMEAMSVGTIPVISSSKHASSELIVNNVNGFVLSPNNATEYIQLICNIINHPSDYKYIKTNSLNTFKLKLSPESWKGNMNNILWQELTGTPQIGHTYLDFKLRSLNLMCRLIIERTKTFSRSLYGFFLFSRLRVKMDFQISCK